MRRAARHAVPLALASLLGAGCAPSAPAPAWADGMVQTWWGPLDTGDGATPFSSGGDFAVRGFVDERRDPVGDRDLLEIVLLNGEIEPGCARYRRWLGRLRELQGVFDGWMELPDDQRPPAADQAGWICQELDGAAREAFGREGRYRALHLLIDPGDGELPDDGVFRPADPGEEPAAWPGAEVLAPKTQVSRFYERSRHGEGLLPESSVGAWTEMDADPIEDCSQILSTLAGEWEEGREDYPDRASLVLQAATHRYYHQYASQAEIAVESGDPRDVGVSVETSESWPAADFVASVAATVFGAVSRAPEGFPYSQALLGSGGGEIPLERCEGLGDEDGPVWPELR